MMNRILAVAHNTFRETIRERVLYNLLFFAVIMALAGLLMDDLSIRQDQKIIKDIGLAAMDVFGTVIAIFIGVGLVSKEVERRSIYPLLAKPLTRDEFLLGKFIGLSSTLLVNLLLMSLGIYLTLFLTSREFDPGLLKAFGPIYLGLVLTVALALAFSTTMSSTLAAVCTFGVVLAGRYSDVILNMREVVEGAPEWLIKTVYWVVPNYRNFDLKNKVVYGDVVAADTLVAIVLYAVTYTGAVLVLALISFRKRELQ